jgi:hypothetical protein
MKNDQLYTGKTKNIMQLNNQFEADLLMEVLMDNGIPAIIEEYDDKVFGETFNEFKGWGSVWAEEKYENDIKKYMEEIRNQKIDLKFDDSSDN